MCPKMSKGHALCQLRPQNLQKKRGNDELKLTCSKKNKAKKGNKLKNAQKTLYVINTMQSATPQ